MFLTTQSVAPGALVTQVCSTILPGVSMKRIVLYLMLLVLAVFANSVHAQQDDCEARKRALDYFYLQSISLLEEYRIDESFEMLRHCLALDTASSAVKYDVSAFYQFMGWDSIAHSMLEEIVEKEPGNLKYSEALLQYYSKVNDKDSAIALYERLLSTSYPKSDIYMALYSIYNDEGDYANALNALLKLEKSAGKSEMISLHKVHQYTQLQDSVNAIAAIRAMVDEYPDNQQYKAFLGDTYLRFGDYANAERSLLHALSCDSDDVLSMSSLAGLYQSIGPDSLYCAAVERLLKSERLATEQRVSLLVDYTNHKEKSDTLYMKGIFKELLELPYDRFEVADIYVRYLIYHKEPSDSIIPVLEEMLLVEPDNTQTLLQLLVYAIEKDDYEEVIKRCDNALLYLPDMLALYYYKGLATYLLGRKENIIEIYKLGLERRSEDTHHSVVSDVYATLGDTYHEFGMMRECKEAYDSALVYNPSNINTLNNYAYYLAIEGGDLQRALDMILKTIEQEPDNAVYIDTYAWVLFKLGRYDEAKVYAEKLILVSRDMSAVECNHCGDIFALCGDIDRALQYWKKAQAEGDNSKILKKKIKKRKYYPDAKR